MDKVTPEILLKIKHINFGCDFKDGLCVAVHKRIDRGLSPMYQICCRACAHNNGYLDIKELPKEYLEYFDKEKGFLGNNGCKLPKEMRSRKCHIYVCRDANISDKDRAILKELEETT